jgi:hypothetical protein
VVDLSEYCYPYRSSGCFLRRNKLALTRFSVSMLVGTIEFIPTARFLSRIVSWHSNGDYEHHLAWELAVVLAMEGWRCWNRRLGNVQGARNIGTEQMGHKEQTGFD